MKTIDLTDATDLVRRFEFGLPLLDALHIAICLRLNATFVSGDRRQVQAAETLGLTISMV